MAAQEWKIQKLVYLYGYRYQKRQNFVRLVRDGKLVPVILLSTVSTVGYLRPVELVSDSDDRLLDIIFAKHMPPRIPQIFMLDYGNVKLEYPKHNLNAETDGNGGNDCAYPDHSAEEPANNRYQ